ncbi:MAG: hypothetical protein ROO76_13180 [Terriglobia bacterium]|nr:hypothetical protein [Terriglobia bacterium]
MISMKRSAWFALVLALISASATSVAQVQDEATLADNKIHLEFMPYLIAPGMGGDVTVNGTTETLNASAGDVLSHLQFGFMARTGISYNRLFVGTDTVYMGLGGANDAVDVGFDQWAAELLGGYRVHPRISLLGGVRYNSLSANLKFKGPLESNIRGSQVWWDPFFGAVGNIPLGKKLSASTRFDIGGFGAGSQIAVNAEPLLNYQFTRRFMGTVGWKFLYQDYVNKGQAFEYDVLTQGPVLGLAIRW